MSSESHLEKTFEALIEKYLTSRGWSSGKALNYFRELGLDLEELILFIESTQFEAWERLKKLHGDDVKALKKFSET